MYEKEWDIQRVKRLKLKLLIQSNVFMLLIFLLAVVYINIGWPISVFLILSCLLLWVLVAYIFSTFISEKGGLTKTSRLVQSFDMDHWGKKRWKRKKVTELVFVSIISAASTVLIVNMLLSTDLTSEILRFFNIIPFIGAWVGFNIGEIVRMNNLK